MVTVSAEQLSLACRIYLDEAYPDGPDSVPAALRAYWEIPADADIELYLTPHHPGVCQFMPGSRPGYRLRLGRAGFSYLRLTLQAVPRDGLTVWLFGVDTHDSWTHPEHPDARAWLALQAANREFKTRTERAWEHAGLLTL